MKSKSIITIMAAAILLSAVQGFAGATYYVNGVNGSDANPGTSGAPWKTIQRSADLMIAGDTVVVAAGSYPERITATRSGASGAMISFTAAGTVECRGFTVRGDYIVVRGFKVTAQEASWSAAAHGIYIEGKYALIENNDAYYSTRGGIHLRPSSVGCVVRNNRAHRNGMVGIEVHGSNHLIENNEIWGSIVYHTPSGINNGDADGFRFFGTGHTFRGNYVHDISFNDPEVVGYDPHIDGFQTWTDSTHVGASHVLFERNLIVLPVYKTTAAHGSGFTLHNCSYTTIRNNIVYTHGGTQTSGSQTAGAGPSNHIVIENNTFIGRLDFIQANFPLGISLQNCADSSITNNIVIDQVLHAIYVDTASLSGLTRSNNLCYNLNGSMPYGQVHYPTEFWGVNPSFVNAAGADYHLNSGSPCINSGMNVPDNAADFDGAARPAGGAYDIGAFEFARDNEAPAITAQPQSRSVTSGQTAALSVTASGTAPLAYQWFRGASGDAANPIPGATSSGYTTPALLQSANYWVRVSNNYGHQDSATAAISVSAPATLPVLTTAVVSSITVTGASSGGTISADGGATVTARGVCWGLTANPTISGSRTSNGSGTGSFTSALTGLSSNTTYHVRAYATNSSGTAYGSDVAFTTSQGTSLALVTTAAASSITVTGAAGGGNVVSDGGTTVTGRGICWGVTANPTTSGSHTSDGSGTGSFASALTSLSPNTTYHVRAYAMNSSGTAYGSDIAFATAAQQSFTVPFSESFSGSVLPSGWTRQNAGTGIVDKWVISETALAGGYPNEMHCSWQDVVSGAARLVTPAIDTTGRSILYLSFRHALGTFETGGVTIRVQTSPDGTTWTDEAWSVLTSSADIGPETVRTTLTQNLNRATTYVALAITGNLHDFDVWDIDDISISATPPGTLRTPALSSPRNGSTRQPTVLKLSWKDTNFSPAEAGYRVRIRPEDGNYAYYDTVRDARSFLLSGLATTKTYYWNVMALGDNGGTVDSAWSNSGKDRRFTTGSQATLLPTILLDPAGSGSSQAAGFEATSGMSAVPVVTTNPVLRWQDTNSNPQEVQYQVRIKQAGGRYVICSAGPNAVEFLAANLKKKTTYYWNIRAKGDRRTTLNSSWANSGRDGVFQTGE